MPTLILFLIITAIQTSMKQLFNVKNGLKMKKNYILKMILVLIINLFLFRIIIPYFYRNLVQFLIQKIIRTNESHTL